jgi:hypothetical protein
MDQGPGFDFKKYIPLLVIIVIVLIAGFFAFNWLTSQRTATITLMGTENNSIEGTITLKDKDLKPVSTSPKGASSTFNAVLWPDEYQVTARADGYQLANQKCIITADNTECKVILTKDIDASLTTTLNGDPTSIHVGQVISGKVQVVNNGQEFNTSDVIPADTNILQVTMLPVDVTTLAQGSSIFIDFNVKIKDTAKISSIQATSVSFKIKGSKITSSKVSLNALPSVSITDITISGGLSQTALVAGEQKSVEITIKNGNKNFPLNDLTVEILPNAGDENKLSWVRFSTADASTPTKVTISSIAPTKAADPVLVLLIKPPLTEDKDSTFSGVIKITSYSIKEGEKTANLNLKVGTAKKATLTIEGVQSPYTIPCHRDTTSCDTKSFSGINGIRLKNSGNVDIGPITIDINFRAATTPNCQAHLTNINTKSNNHRVELIKSGESEELIVSITAPYNTPDTEIAKCVVEWYYPDPLSSPSRIVYDNIVFEIRKNTTDN